MSGTSLLSLAKTEEDGMLVFPRVKISSIDCEPEDGVVKAQGSFQAGRKRGTLPVHQHKFITDSPRGLNRCAGSSWKQLWCAGDNGIRAMAGSWVATRIGLR